MKPGRTYALLLTALTSVAYSQDVHNGTAIFIPSSISVYANNVNNTGFIQNNGIIEVTGNWNSQTVYQGLGTIILSGGDQKISNNNQDIQNLMVDGGGTKSFDGNLSINGSFDLVNGIVNVSEDQTLLIEVNASVEGGSSSSFVNGPLTIRGTGYKFFPVGNKTNYYPITLTDVTGLDPVIQVEALKDLPNVSTDHEIEVHHNFYWTEKVVAGRYDGSPVMVLYPESNDKIAFISGSDFEDEFNVVEGQWGNGAITSQTRIGKSIIALGTIPPEPIQPAYLSTTMSPNAMNPDNRLIKVFGTEMSETNFSFRIFNRWGNVLFESNSLAAMINEGWDGKQNGQLLPAGAYPYKMSYVNYEGREGIKTGFITIVY